METKQNSTLQTRAVVEWVPKNKVMPNPLNPRRNDAVESEEMLEIISNKGWEEPLTVYRRNRDVYVVLAGHRRLYVANKMKNVKELPVYIVERPKDHQEEIERIASLQRGRVDWTQYEWAKFTYERWLAWDRPAINKFAKRIGIKRNTVKQYLRVLDYFPQHEIESLLLRQAVAIGGLDAVVVWIGKIKLHKPHIVNELDEELIRQNLTRKLEKNLITRDSLRSDKFVDVSSDDDFRDFLLANDITLEQAQESYGVKNEGEKTFHGHLTSFGQFRSNITKFKPNTESEKERAIESLESLESTIRQQIATIKNSRKDID